MARLGEESLFHGRRNRYPWDEWLDGQIWVLRKGEDFHSSCEAFRVTVGNETSKRKVRYRTTRVGADEIAIQCLGPVEAPGHE